MVGILSGSGTVYVDDQPYEIEKEQVFLLCPQQLHAIHCGEKNRCAAENAGCKIHRGGSRAVRGSGARGRYVPFAGFRMVRALF
ncbi:AraC family ligand binding domain-containing protein [Ruthenibacterium lactatiformans]|uniref:AraC family ligand binding domain-containing protein n=1 Tax=Ruthenibacterium lactatiformans TaxID=1550024 RepID=UPI003BFA66F4